MNPAWRSLTSVSRRDIGSFALRKGHQTFRLEEGKWRLTDRPGGPRRASGWPKLGYAQELKRSWSGFQNFAISFTIISVLAGCFTTYYQGWNNGGPVAISWGWPIISAFILIIAFCMSELVSAYPTAGGIYWWASKLGGAGLGLVHRLVQPARA